MPKKKQANSCSPETNSSHTWNSRSVYLMLELYYERVHKFRNPLVMKKILWLEMLEEMQLAGFKGLTWKGLDRKMRNLKVHYFKAKKLKGSKSSWEYYGILSSIYDDTSEREIIHKPEITDEPEITSKIEVKTEIKSADEISPATPPNTEEFCDEFIQEDYAHDTKYLSDDSDSDSSEMAEDPVAASASPACRQYEKKHKGSAQKYNASIELMMQKIDEANRIQRERNAILKQILNKLK